MALVRFSAALVALALVTGCTSYTSDSTSDETMEETMKSSMKISGDLAYRERIALLPGAVATVTLSDVSIADRAAPVLSEQTIALDGKQVPIPFELNVDRSALNERARYAVRGVIKNADGKMLWTTDTSYPIVANADENEMGTLTLVRVQSTTSQTQTPLEGTNWTILSLNGVAVGEGRTPTLDFGANGRVGGQGFCNRYFATYTQDGNTVSFGQAGTTRMACAGSAMQQDSQLLDILSGASKAKVDSDGFLTVATPDGRYLKAQRTY